MVTAVARWRAERVVPAVAEIFPFLAATPAVLVGPGDDAAVLATSGGCRGDHRLDGPRVGTGSTSGRPPPTSPRRSPPRTSPTWRPWAPCRPRSWSPSSRTRRPRARLGCRVRPGPRSGRGRSGRRRRGGDLSSAPAGPCGRRRSPRWVTCAGVAPVLRVGRAPGRPRRRDRGPWARPAPDLRCSWAEPTRGRERRDPAYGARLRPVATTAANRAPWRARAGRPRMPAPRPMLDLSDGLLRDRRPDRAGQRGAPGPRLGAVLLGATPRGR